MSALPAIAANLWLLGLPVVLILAAALALLQRAPGRCRYLVALAGFVAVVVVPVLATPEGAPVVAATEMPAGAAGASSTVDLGALVLVVWLGGAALLFARELGTHLRLARSRRSWTPAGPGLRQAVAMRGERPLWLADVASPRTHGLLAPAIVLPRALVGALDDAVARRIVAHEEAHARWRDPLVHAFVRLVRAALWVSPAIWIAERLVRREREAAADEAALRGEGDEVCARYATTLVELGRNGSRRTDLLAVRLGAAADLEYRVRRILRLSRARLSTGGSALAVLLAGALALAFTPRSEAPGRVTVRPDDGSLAVARALDLASRHDGGVEAQTVLPVRAEEQSPAPARAPRAPTAPLSSASPGSALASHDPVIVPPEEPGDLAVAVTATDLASGASEPLVEPPPGGAVPSAEPATGGDVDRHAHVHIDVHREEGVYRASLPASDGRDDAVIVLRDVDRIRRVIRTSDGRGYEVGEDVGGRSKHPVALFHRAVTAPIKRWLRARDEPPPAAPAEARSRVQ